jgi:hypothetical protein
MDSPSPTPPPAITEHALATEYGLPRRTLEDLRKKHLSPADWSNVPRQGVTYTPDGLDRMKELLAALPQPEKNEAPPAVLAAPPTFTLITLGPLNRGNGRVGQATIEGQPGSRCYVRIIRHNPRVLQSVRAGLRLEGCIRVNDELFDYPPDGPLPSRPGAPMPKKEGGAAA